MSTNRQINNELKREYAPTYSSAKPRAINLAHFSSSCASSLSINTCSIVLVISPLQLPTKMNPSASADNDAISILWLSSATSGRSKLLRSSRCDPTYAKPSPTIALTLQLTVLDSTCSPRSANAASASVRTPQLRIPVARNAPAYSEDKGWDEYTGGFHIGANLPLCCRQYCMYTGPHDSSRRRCPTTNSNQVTQQHLASLK